MLTTDPSCNPQTNSLPSPLVAMRLFSASVGPFLQQLFKCCRPRLGRGGFQPDLSRALFLFGPWSKMVFLCLKHSGHRSRNDCSNRRPPPGAVLRLQRRGVRPPRRSALPQAGPWASGAVCALRGPWAREDAPALRRGAAEPCEALSLLGPQFSHL